MDGMARCDIGTSATTGWTGSIRRYVHRAWMFSTSALAGSSVAIWISTWQSTISPTSSSTRPRIFWNQGLRLMPPRWHASMEHPVTPLALASGSPIEFQGNEGLSPLTLHRGWFGDFGLQITRSRRSPDNEHPSPWYL